MSRLPPHKVHWEICSVRVRICKQEAKGTYWRTRTSATHWDRSWAKERSMSSKRSQMFNSLSLLIHQWWEIRLQVHQKTAKYRKLDSSERPEVLVDKTQAASVLTLLSTTSCRRQVLAPRTKQKQLFSSKWLGQTKTSATSLASTSRNSLVSILYSVVALQPLFSKCLTTMLTCWLDSRLGLGLLVVFAVLIRNAQ